MSCRFISNQSGVSIVQGLVLAAVIAGMAYIGTRMTTDQKLIAKTAESRSKIEDLHNLVYGIMQNREHCKATLTGTTVAAGATTPLTSIKTLGGGVPFRVQSGTNYMYLGNAVAINSINITYPPDLKDLATMTMEYSRLESDNANRRSGQGFGSKTIKKNISIKIQRKAGAFDYCYAVETGENSDLIKEFCEQLGSDGTAANAVFQWDPNNNVCVPRNLNCPSGQVFAGFDSNGQRRCYAIKDWMNFGDLIDNTGMSCPSGSADVRFMIAPDGKHVKIYCAGPACGADGYNVTGTSCATNGGSCTAGPPVTCQGTPQQTKTCCNASMCTVGSTITVASGPYGSCFGPPPSCSWTTGWTNSGSCSGGLQPQSRTCGPVGCSGSCSGPSTQSIPCSCPNVMATSPVSSWCYREVGGKCGSRDNIKDCQVGSCGASDGTGCTIPTRTADPWATWGSQMPCANYALGSMPSCTSMGL